MAKAAAGAATSKEGGVITSPFKNAPFPREELTNRVSRSGGRQKSRGREDEDDSPTPTSTELFAHLPQYRVSAGCPCTCSPPVWWKERLGGDGGLVA